MSQNKSTLNILRGLFPDSIVQWIFHICGVYICGFNQPQIEKVFDLARNQNVWFWFVWNIWKGKVTEKKSRISGFQGLGRKWGLIANGEGVSFKNYGNVLKLDGGNGFRKGRGTRDQIANIRWIIEKAREFQKNIYFCFIDYAKAFDCVDHNKLENP